MFDPLVRDAGAGDAAQLAWLEREARASLSAMRGGLRWLEAHTEIGSAWPSLLDDDDRAVFVADLDGVAVGYMVVAFDPDGTARIDQVWVTPHARGNGYGDAMMEAAVSAGRARRCVRIEGEALPGDRETKNLYERAGVTARLIVVSAPL